MEVMIGVPAFCCLPIDISVRLIGTVSLLTNALVFIALVSNSNEVLKDDKIRIIFGFDALFFNFDSLTENFNGNKISGNASAQFISFLRKFSTFFSEWFSTYCLVFTLASAVSSALLIGGSITAQRWLTVPWLICSIFNVFCHFTSLLMLSFLRSPYISEWVTAFAVLYSITLIYFILIVTIAHYLWWIQSKESRYNSRIQSWENIYKSPPLFESSYKDRIGNI